METALLFTNWNTQPKPRRNWRKQHKGEKSQETEKLIPFTTGGKSRAEKNVHNIVINFFKGFEKERK
jgi:hypothetical protein